MITAKKNKKEGWNRRTKSKVKRIKIPKTKNQKGKDKNNQYLLLALLRSCSF
jgi:hypothetical protein